MVLIHRMPFSISSYAQRCADEIDPAVHRGPILRVTARFMSWMGNKGLPAEAYCDCDVCAELRRLRAAPPGELAAFAREAAEVLERTASPRVAALLASAERSSAAPPPTVGDYLARAGAPAPARRRGRPRKTGP